MAKDKVFIGLREVAGYFSNLKAGFDEIGIKATFLNLGGSRFNYSIEKNPKWVSVLNYIGIKVGSKFDKNFILRFIWLTIFQNIFSVIAFFIALFSYNVFIMSANSTFFYFIELPILKLFKKKIIYVFLGTDSRPFYLNGYVYDGSKKPNLLILLSKIQKKVIKRIEKYADVIVNHPPQAYYHEKPFVSSLYIGIPYKEKKEKPEKDPKNSNNIKIIHIPSKSGPKGSIKFREIINKLKKKYAIDYFEISGIPNDEVINIISGANIAIDEFYSDTPMAVFATECAFQAVPVVVGSYYATSIYNDYPKTIIPPSMFVMPEDIEKAIEKLIVDKEYRVEFGKKAFDFVTENWSAKIVAEKYMKLINNDFPDEWLFDPNKIEYVYGCGLSKKQLISNIKSFCAKKGVKSLCLKDKPHLEKKFLEMINDTSD